MINCNKVRAKIRARIKARMRILEKSMPKVKLRVNTDFGCSTPIPDKLLKAALLLDGKCLSIQDIIDYLQKYIDNGMFRVEPDFIAYSSGKQVYIPCKDSGLLLWENNWLLFRIER